jgi:hypothetical protein
MQITSDYEDLVSKFLEAFDVDEPMCPMVVSGVVGASHENHNSDVTVMSYSMFKNNKRSLDEAVSNAQKLPRNTPADELLVDVAQAILSMGSI